MTQTTRVRSLSSANLSEQVSEMFHQVKPKLRGWIHLATAPLALAAGIVLITLTPTVAGKLSVVVFAFSTVLLFGHSAVYHRGTWSPRAAAILRRMDHANIFLLIAGTYTPLSVILLDYSTATLVLSVVWIGALVGIALRLLWLRAPRWLYVPLYIALGWVAVAFLRDFWTAGGPAVFWLVLSGGIAYTVGAIVYGTRWPDPAPRWFGFHEIFHLCTVGGYVCHCIAVFMAAVSLW
ncbi:MAG: hemolysin III family protein [Bowdeniella nasicola]|nr:hemolysin III family protein [Bowdeniella nasicola]